MKLILFIHSKKNIHHQVKINDTKCYSNLIVQSLDRILGFLEVIFAAFWFWLFFCCWLVGVFFIDKYSLISNKSTNPTRSLEVYIQWT